MDCHGLSMLPCASRWVLTSLDELRMIRFWTAKNESPPHHVKIWTLQQPYRTWNKALNSWSQEWWYSAAATLQESHCFFSLGARVVHHAHILQNRNSTRIKSQKSGRLHVLNNVYLNLGIQSVHTKANAVWKQFLVVWTLKVGEIVTKLLATNGFCCKRCNQWSKFPSR